MRNLTELHAREYKRFTFYFPHGDETQVGYYIDVPDHRVPGVVRDLHFKFCGQKLKKSAEFEAFVDEYVPAKFRDRFAKSEKGIDIEICCDAFKLAAASRLERLFLLTNDDDFIPLCRTLKEYGANVSLIHLTNLLNPNLSLLKETDSYDVVSTERLRELFVEAAEEAPALPQLLEEAESGDVAKADAPPSALVLVEGSAPPAGAAEEPDPAGGDEEEG
jgi:hypothetical protein